MTSTVSPTPPTSTRLHKPSLHQIQGRFSRRRRRSAERCCLRRRSSLRQPSPAQTAAAGVYQPRHRPIRVDRRSIRHIGQVSSSIEPPGAGRTESRSCSTTGNVCPHRVGPTRMLAPSAIHRPAGSVNGVKWPMTSIRCRRKAPEPATERSLPSARTLTLSDESRVRGCRISRWWARSGGSPAASRLASSAK